MFCVNSVFAQKISYTHQDITLKEVQKNKSWEPFNERIYNGLDNGVYWFKVELEATQSSLIITLPEAHLSRTNLYENTREILPLPKKRFQTYKIPPSTESRTLFIKVNCLLEARIPIEILKSDDYFEEEATSRMIIGIYIGIVLCIILINLFSYLSFRNITYLQYTLMVVGLSMNVLYKDGLVLLIFGNGIITESVEPFINSILPIAAVLFTTSYLNLKKELPQLRKVGIGFIVLAFACIAIFISTGNKYAFSSISILLLLSCDVFWIAGILLWNKSIYAKILALAYGVPLLFAHDFYISPHLGIHGLGLPLWTYKAGSVIEMVVFTYAIMYQAKTLADENNQMRQKLKDYTDRIKLNRKSNEIGVQLERELQKKFALTNKEIEILREISAGKLNKKIAEEQFISENTVKFHVRNIFNKLDVKSKRDAGYLYLNFSPPSE